MSLAGRDEGNPQAPPATMPADCEASRPEETQPPPSFAAIYRVTVMSWCFQFMLDLLWIPLAAYFKDLDLGLHVLGAVFAMNLGVRIIPNVLATRLGVKTDIFCMCCGLACFAVNLAFPTETWAIFAMSGGGGMTFVRAHLSVHGKVAACGNKDMLTLAAKWCGAARNAGTVVAFALPVVLYNNLGWISVVLLAMCVMVLYVILAVVQHASAGQGADSAADKELLAGLVEEAPAESIPWIDWVMAGCFCVTELQMNVGAAAVPTTLMRTFGVPMPLVGGLQAVGQLVAMSFLMLLSKGFFIPLQKRPMNLIFSFSGTFLTMVAIWAAIVLHTGSVWLIIGCLYGFYMSAYTAQVTMLECLMGVLDMQNSIIVMGIAEVFGCGFSLVGGYLGPALLEVDPAAPFALQVAIALLTTMVLALCLGHRAWTQVVVCEMEAQYDSSIQDMISRRPSVLKSIQGLKKMTQRPESYIGVEQRFRKQNSSSRLAPIASSGSLCPSNESEQPPVQTQGGGQNNLAEPLMDKPQPAQRTSGHRRCSSEVVPIPDTVASTHEARHFKKAMVNFEQAFLALDLQDYDVPASSVKELVVTHRRVRSVL